MTYGESIHAALRAALNVDFPVVTYPSHVMTVGATMVKPATLLIYQDEATFDRAVLNRTNSALPRERTGSTWVVDLKFERDVSTEAVENALMASPPRIARGSAPGIEQQVTLELLGASYVHPVQGQPAKGSQVRLRFNANYKRI